jgi:putative hydrolase of the HAD superfamily
MKAVLFDMDNTLFDFVAKKYAAFGAIMRYLGRPDEESRELYDYFTRPGHDYEDPENIRDYLGDRGIRSDLVFSRCREIYSVEKCRDLIPFPGIPDTLAWLRAIGLLTAVVTDARRNNTLLRLSRTGLLPLFDCVATAEESGTKKPDPGVLLLALTSLGVRPKDAVLVGDSMRRDIAAGRMLGMQTVYAAYGDRTGGGPFSFQADFVVSSVIALQETLHEILVKDQEHQGKEVRFDSPTGELGQRSSR